MKVLIVGAGIVGAACAEYLAQRGLQVTVIEPGTVGGGTTGAGMGHLVVLDGDEQELALTSLGCRLWQSWLIDHPVHAAYQRCGTLWLARDEIEMEEAQRKYSRLNAMGIEVSLLDRSQIRASEPFLAHDIVGGVRVPADGVVYPPACAQLMLESAMSMGARLIRDQVIAVDPYSVRIKDGSRLHADAVIIAAGHAARSLIPTLPLRTKRGLLAITDRYPTYLRHQVVELGYIKSAHQNSGTSVACNIQPRPTGQLLIGSSREFDTEHSIPDFALLARMLARCTEFLPVLGHLNVLRCWSGLRSFSPDGQPLLGPSNIHDGVYLACGHEGLGVTTALASAHLLGAQLLDEAPALALDAYLPARFARELAA